MKLKAEQDKSCEDIEITVRYAEKNDEVDRILSFLNSVNMQIKCGDNGAETMVNILDIYYIESVDKKTFIYLEKKVYRTMLRLYQLMEDLKKYGFVQISKSCILNINVLESIKPIFNSRMEAVLKNGEKVHVNRRYIRDVKKALEREARV